MDSFDLFKKLSNGAKLRSTFKSPKPTKIAKEVTLIKPEPDENTAEQWLSSQIDDEDKDWLNYTKEEEEWSGLDDNEDDENDGKLRSVAKDDNSDRKAKKRKHEEITLLGNLTVSDANEDALKIEKKKKKRKKNRNEEVENTAEKIKQAEIERVNALRKKLRVYVAGGGVPPPIETFDELKTRYRVSDILIKNLREAKYTEPTPIQAQAWPIMLSKRQILACAPTGSGKTVAFLLPVLHMLKTPSNVGFRAVVVSPTRELARQTFRECQRLSEGTGIRAHIISKVGPVDPGKVSKANKKKYDILITTPNRLVYMLNQEPPAVSLRSVQWLIIDESDKLFEAGSRGFRDQLATIYQACDSENVMRAMFSATHGAHVASWCKKNLKGLIAVTVGLRNTAAELVDQKLIFVGNEQGKLLAMRELILKGITPPVLIFLQSKERAKELFQELLYDGINVDVIHADRTQLQRDNVVRSFREGKIWVLICTELMGRGIDFKGVNLVINYDFPQSAVSYIHRIGRTARAGRKGQAITFFTESDKPLLRSIATVMRDSGCEVPQFMLDLKKISKKEKRRLENHAPEREHILSSLPKPQKQDPRDPKKKKSKNNNDKTWKNRGIEENSSAKNNKFKKKHVPPNGGNGTEEKRESNKLMMKEKKQRKGESGIEKHNEKNKPFRKTKHKEESG